MENVKTILENKVEIPVLLRKKQNWYIVPTLSSPKTVFVDDVGVLLYMHRQLVYINNNTIINVEYIDTVLSNIVKEYIVIEGKMYIISPKYMLLLRHLLKERYPSIYASINNHTKGIYLRGINSKTRIDIENIECLIRKSTQTIIFYKDGTTSYFYETLKYFNENILKRETFIKIRRDCIVNIKHINNFKIDKRNKTGEIYVKSQILSISRRNLTLFKKTWENSTFA